MARMLKWLSSASILSALTISSVGCVPQEKYNAKVLESEQQSQALSAAESEQQQEAAQNKIYKQQVDDLNTQLATLQGENRNLDAQNKDLSSQEAALDAKYKDLNNQPPHIEINQVSNGGNALPPALANALADFAAANPGVVEFDPIRGVVKFKSDVTFDTGSHVLKPEARTVIDKFAKILNSAAASEYELDVAGHTDNVPVTNRQTIANGDVNNISLSAHRAISVYSELASQGVSTGRMSVTGYGDERPISDNGTAEGRRQNRRVEVLILPTRRGSAVTASAGGTPHRTTHRSAEQNKDAMVPAPAPAPTSADASGDLNK